MLEEVDSGEGGGRRTEVAREVLLAALANCFWVVAADEVSGDGYGPLQEGSV